MEYRSEDKNDDGEKIHGDEAQPDWELDAKAYLRIQREELEVIGRKLGLVKLSWTDWRTPRQAGNDNVETNKGDSKYFDQLSSSYRSTSDLEKAFLWYAENFRRQYRTAYPSRKPLLLTCSNECNVQKFVSVSIRRTVLPYSELSTWQGCANFVSNFFTYEPLAEPLLLPKHLRSPTYIQYVQRGNSFELATFLVCLLLGLGYNAYVANGYASREQSLCDRTKMSCPYLRQSDQVVVSTIEPVITKYRPKSPLNFQSQFLSAIEEKRANERTREKEEQEEAKRRAIAEAERPDADRHFGQRVHAWVVLLPGGQIPPDLEITEPLFVEPTTGTSYASGSFESANLYLGIESLWNDRNYWVNVQDCSEACTKLNWDLTNLRCWEHLLAGEPKNLLSLNERDNDDDDNDGYDDGDRSVETKIRQNFHMIVPASYVDPIRLPYEAYERRYPGGQKTMLYKKTKVQLFAPYTRDDGLIQSIVTYDDYDCNTPLFVYETYDNRCDCLERSEKDLNGEITTDYYTTGRPDACRVHRYSLHGRDSLDEERTLEFYGKKRRDELICVKTHRTFASLDYENRDDGLCNRFVEYSTSNDDNVQRNVHCRAITKITDTFDGNKLLETKTDVEIREFDFVENEIRLTYRYNEDEYTQAIKRFSKPAKADRSNKNPSLPEILQNYQPDPTGPEEDPDELIDELEIHLNEEDASITEARHAETVVRDFLQLKSNERKRSALRVSRFDPLRNRETREKILLEEEKKKEQSKKEIEEEADFLSPYFAQLGNVEYLTKKQALQMRNNCLDDLKENSIAKANRILQQFETCNKELETMQSMLIDSENLKKDQKEQLLKNIKEVEAKLRSMDLYLNRHRQLVSTRYANLVKVLQKSQQLSVLYNDE